MARAPYFFLTYAHTPDRSWVRRLYRSLCEEIIERTDWPPEIPVGFMDESGIHTGDDWRQAIAGALATSRVLVPLYSRRYFTRPECGKEWHAFDCRVLEHRARHGAVPAPIVPALWTPVSDQHLPTVAQHVQADFHRVHPTYARDGLYTLIKNAAYRTTYLKVVKHLAELIIEAAETIPLSPCEVNELDLSCNAFHTSPASVPANRRLSVLIAAPKVQRMPPDRAADFYGTTEIAWNPYHPQSRRPIADAAGYIARALGYEPDIVPADVGLSTRDWSSPDAGLGIILLDPWLCLDPTATAQLRQMDQLSEGRLGAVVVWNSADPQTRLKAEEIRKLLRATAPRVLGEPGTPSLGSVHVHSLEQFDTECPRILDRAFNRYLNDAPVASALGASGEMPHLNGPGTDPATTDDQQTGGSDGD